MQLASSAAREGCGKRAVLSGSGCSQASLETNYVGIGTCAFQFSKPPSSVQPARLL